MVQQHVLFHTMANWFSQHPSSQRPQATEITQQHPLQPQPQHVNQDDNTNTNGAPVPSSSSSTTTNIPLIDRALSNPVFAGGAGIAALAAAASVGRQALLAGMQLARRYGTISLEVASKDRAYRWLLPYLHAQTANAQHIGVHTQIRQSGDASGHVTSTFNYIPSLGQHYFWYRRHLIAVQRKRESGVVDLSTGEPYETVELKTLGRNRQIFTDILNDARRVALTREQGKTVLYTPMGLEWKPFGNPRRSRPLRSVVLGVGVAERLLADLTEFTSSAAWYAERGIPYRRGYLLYGPPGCGKSSFIAALAGELKYNICLLNLNERGLTDDRLAALLSVVPPRSFVLLEDIDAALPAVRPGESGAAAAASSRHSYSVTFSGLLNVLDGVASGDERVIFMTTNYVERLDAALIRPGRVDVQQRIGLASKHQIYVMYNRFYPQNVEDAKKFVEILDSVKAELSVAELQAYFLLHKTDAAAALRDAPELAHQASERQKMHQQQQQQNASSDRTAGTSHSASVATAARL